MWVTSSYIQVWLWPGLIIIIIIIIIIIMIIIIIIRHIHPTGIYNDGRDSWRMPEIPLKISRAIICKKARELRHNNFMGQGESVLCNFAERAPM